MDGFSFGTLLQHWSGPAGFMVLMGAIVWGIQLNVGFVQLNRRQAEHDKELKDIERELSKISHNALETAILLKETRRDIEQATRHVEEHNNEAEGWRRRIVTVETHLSALERAVNSLHANNN